jgi:hypothetical protein
MELPIADSAERAPRDQVCVRWRVLPRDLIAAPLRIQHGAIELDLTPGEVCAVIRGYEPRATISERIRQAQGFAEGALRAMQVFDSVPHEIHLTEMNGYREDGSPVAVTIEVEASLAQQFFVGGEAERLTRKEHFARVLAQHPSDTFLLRMLHSYDAAMRDPANELVHLYEIGEQLEQALGRAAAEIQSVKKLRKALEARTNDRRLAQGRHRGQLRSLEVQRAASHAELEQTRRCAIECMIFYVAWLERHGNTRA